uniref:EF-hand domain-containing protein n=1 Tax=Alexandrium catenella TaxID=2925 RepID=A0A7S1RU28_ALECA|mmetsp:Transcript_72371/g.192251  ORF Transcript_72371/g.192251 Transcript_72371/m.192251 type:complete len:377 (+) Transcript_72371:85-1215(+)|eukprot:CAMPEP_0171188786 /NCGR_PEP_ID=MMETSP0790-20130122/18012_1 /TAXON_ID=2925 /ORGANISM="Alexandrium catenella, Strain OF101" /LENGTH=376 /DNA_ID=CAMNT_0011653881 /DNA_START=55 /DNA_END=1185 /DNA_ORIENTATION=-
MPATDAKKAQLKQRFREMDKNKDGMLDFNEFLDLMQGLDTRTAHKLFEKCDTSGDGTISFDEFVDYIYETEKSRAGRTTEGRHARLRAMNEVSAESEDAGLWDRCQSVFDTYQGMDEKFEGKDLKKLCIDCKLFDRKFTKNDVDIVFAKHKTKGKNFIGFPEFQNCVRGIAQKKGVPTKVVQVAVSEREDVGIQQNATQADFVRFHDDKSTYTGAHVWNENHDGAGGADYKPGSRAERIKADTAVDHDAQEELPWDGVQQAFMAFCKGDDVLDGREFSQLCQDCGLFVRSKFTSADADIIFNKVKNRGERKIDYEQFKDACISVATKRGSSVADVQMAVMKAHGPSMHGATQADSVRFHDDKSLYTGSHAFNERHM